MDVKIRKVFRSGNLIGVPVKTPELKSVGEIEEIVVDVHSGRVIYAVLCFGGHFGFGEKFFAVPWKEFSLVRDEAESYFVIDTSREKLKRLQGFKKTDWPIVVDSNWDQQLSVSAPGDDQEFEDEDYEEVEQRDEDE